MNLRSPPHNFTRLSEAKSLTPLWSHCILGRGSSLAQWTDLRWRLLSCKRSKNKTDGAFSDSTTCTLFVFKDLEKEASVFSSDAKQISNFSVTPKVKGHICWNLIYIFCILKVACMTIWFHFVNYFVIVEIRSAGAETC